MGWRLTVKAGKAHMKNKRRKTGKRRWSGGATNAEIQQKDDLTSFPEIDSKFENQREKFIYAPTMYKIPGFFNAIGPVEAGELLTNGEYMIRPVRYAQRSSIVRYNDLIIAFTCKTIEGAIHHDFIDFIDKSTKELNSGRWTGKYVVDLHIITQQIQLKKDRYNVTNHFRFKAAANFSEIQTNSRLFTLQYKNSRFTHFGINADAIITTINSPKHIIFITVQYPGIPTYNENGLTQDYMENWINNLKLNPGAIPGKSSISIGAILYDRYVTQRIQKPDLQLTKMSYVCILENPTNEYNEYIKTLFTNIEDNTHIYIVGHCCDINDNITSDNNPSLSTDILATFLGNSSNTAAITYIDINACFGYRFFKNKLIQALATQNKFPIVCSNELPVHRSQGTMEQIKNTYDYDRINWGYVSKQIDTEIVDLHLSMFYSVGQYATIGGINTTSILFSDDRTIDTAINRLFTFVFSSSNLLFNFIKTLPVFFKFEGVVPKQYRNEAETILKSDGSNGANIYILRFGSFGNPYEFIITYNVLEKGSIIQKNTRIQINNGNVKLVHADPSKPLPNPNYCDPFPTLGDIIRNFFPPGMKPFNFDKDGDKYTNEHRKFLGLPLLDLPLNEDLSEEKKDSSEESADTPIVVAPTLADPTLVATPVVASPEPSIAAISYPATDSTAPINIANPVVASNTDPIGDPVENPNIHPLPKDTVVLYKGKQYSVESSNNNKRFYHLKDYDAKEEFQTNVPFNNVTINTSPTITSIASTIASEEDPIPQAIATAAASGVAPIIAPTTTTAAFIASSKNGHPDEIKTDPIVLAQSTIPTVPNAAPTIPTADPTVPNAASTVPTAALTVASTADPTVPTVSPTSLTTDPIDPTAPTATPIATASITALAAPIAPALAAPTAAALTTHSISNITHEPNTTKVTFKDGVTVTATKIRDQQYECIVSSQT
jgi:hypothetical protein